MVDSTSQLVDINQNAKKLPQFAAVLSATIGAVALGHVLAWTSPIEEDMQSGGYGFPISLSQYGWVGSMACLGASVSCYVTGPLSDMLGRRGALLTLALPFILGWLLVILANSLGWLLAGRFFLGLAGGAFCVISPIYASETAQKEIRGTLGSFNEMMTIVGVLATYVIGRWTTPQHLAIASSVTPIVFFLIFFFMPESPYFLYKNGRVAEARHALTWLRGKDYNSEDEMQGMSRQIDEEKRSEVPLSQSFKKRSTRMAALIGFGLMSFQQLGGINAVVFYTSQIFSDAKIAIDPKDASIIVGTCQLLSCVLAAFFIDRAGRRIVLLISVVVMGLCSLALAIYFTLKRFMTPDEISDFGFLPILSLCLFVMAFEFGIGPIPWILVAEITPPEALSFVGPVSGALNWFLAFLVTKFYGDVADIVGVDITFYFFSIVTAFGLIFVWFLVPETKGKTLEETQRMMEGPQAHVE